MRMKRCPPKPHICLVIHPDTIGAVLVERAHRHAAVVGDDANQLLAHVADVIVLLQQGDVCLGGLPGRSPAGRLVLENAGFLSHRSFKHLALEKLLACSWPCWSGTCHAVIFSYFVLLKRVSLVREGEVTVRDALPRQKRPPARLPLQESRVPLLGRQYVRLLNHCPHLWACNRL